jgi:hypothetical protein
MFGTFLAGQRQILVHIEPSTRLTYGCACTHGFAGLRTYVRYVMAAGRPLGAQQVIDYEEFLNQILEFTRPECANTIAIA